MPREYKLKQIDRATSAHIDYEAELNPQQLAAVTAPPGPALVIAGAGSGKTRTLIYRTAYLLDNGIPPENILLLTFTNKAAREMIYRVESLVPADTSRLWGGTFHSIGNRLLRRHAEKIGFSRGFSILDREDQKDLLATVVAECEIDPKAMRFPKPAVLAEMFSLAQNCRVGLEEVIAARFSYFAHLLDAIEKVERQYTAKKVATNSMDFDDLLLQTLRLFEENDDLLERYQHQFQFVLVDEYQDTNAVQSELIDLFAAKHGNVMVVGDDAQSIYSWRGANFENILKFPKRYPKAQVFKIETNYRSVPEVLHLANEAIAQNARQFEKVLQPDRAPRESLPALVPVDDPNTQAKFVAQRILELRDEGVELHEIAVLYRAHYQSMEIQMELTNRGIPFVITSGLRFFEQAHIKDVAAFMKIAVNRHDEIAFKRILRMLPGVGSKTSERLWRNWQDCPGHSLEKIETFSQYLLEFTVPKRGQTAWKQLAYTLDELIPGGEMAPPVTMIESVLEAVYYDYLRSKYTNAESRHDDLEQLMNYSRQFDDVYAFLSQLALLSGVDGGPESQHEQESEMVTLSSVHQAKGLEWRAVFVISLCDGLFPNARAVDTEGGLEEERRLFYVALTRARDELYLTHPITRPSGWEGDAMQRRSPFLEEIDADLLEEWHVAPGF